MDFPDGSQQLLATSGRLYRHDALGPWQSRQLPPAFAVEPVQAVVQDGRGRIWIRGRQTLLALAGFEAPVEDLSASLPGAAVQKGELYLDRTGRVWAPTNHGIAWFDGPRRGLIDTSRGLTNEWATTVMVDREGSLWVGSEGVQRLQGRLAWTSFTRRQGLPSDTVWAVLRDRNGTLWAATNSGVAQAKQGGWVTLPMSRDRSFYAFAQSPSGDLWIGGNSGHAGTNTLLVRTHGASNFRAVSLGSAVGPSTVNSLAFGPDGALYVATLAHGLHRLIAKGADYTSGAVVLPGGDAKEQINQLAIDRAGHLWVSSKRGLAVFDGHHWHRLDASDGLREQEIETITPADSNSVWVSYWNLTGLTLVRITDSGAVISTQLTRPEALVADTIYSAGLDRKGVLWLGTAMGIKRFRNGVSERFGQSDGLPGEDAAANGFWGDADGDVWFGMANGLAHFSARNDVALAPPPTTVITGLQDGHSRLLSATIPSVPWKDRALTFHVAALGFLYPGRVQRQVRLLGLEDAWRDTNVSESRFTGLLPGSYRFQARSRYSDGVFSAVASRAVVILPPWWLTWWFLTLAAMACGLLAVLAVRSRHAHLHRKNLQLEALVADRTRDLLIANAAIEESSMIDPLTGLKNRRYLDAFMPEELARCIREIRSNMSRKPAERHRNIDLCVFMVDLDHFKSVNDDHGHAAGDIVLQQVGVVLRKACRESDMLVRWGGEEFLILARNSDRCQVQALASQVCEAIRQHPFDLGNGVVLRKSCSLGFAAFPLLPSKPDRFGWDQTLKLADRCMYAAKRSGRNAWVGCLLQDNVPVPADPTPGMLHEIDGYGPCRVVSSFPEGHALHW